MPARMRRRRAFLGVAVGALAAGALAAGALAALPTIDALKEVAPDVSALGNHELDRGRAGPDDRVPELIDSRYLAANIYDRGTGLPSFEEPDPAQRAVDVQVEVPEGGFTDASSGTLTSPTEAFGLSGASESTSVAEVSASTVSAPVVVSADALWTFDAQALTVNSTITSTITEVDVGLRGHQAEIDRCAGPVVSDYGAYGKVVGEHNHCGGAYVLELEVGDVVRLAGYEAGQYVVAFLLDVPKKNTPVSVLSGAELFLQTCHFTGGQMRLVALTPQ